MAAVRCAAAFTKHFHIRLRGHATRRRHFRFSYIYLYVYVTQQHIRQIAYLIMLYTTRARFIVLVDTIYYSELLCVCMVRGAVKLISGVVR